MYEDIDFLSCFAQSLDVWIYSEVPLCHRLFWFSHLARLWWNNLFLPTYCKIHASGAFVSLILCSFLCIWYETWQVTGLSQYQWQKWPPCGALLFAGGLDVKSQEAALRAAPDILIATPGRLIDHLHNCPSFHLSSIEVLILDEADRYTWNGGAPGALRSRGPHPWTGTCHPALFFLALTIAIGLQCQFSCSRLLSPSLAWITLLSFSLSVMW